MKAKKMKTMLNTDQTSTRSRRGQAVSPRVFLADLCLQCNEWTSSRSRPSFGRRGLGGGAEVWQPNATLRASGIETGGPVLDHNHYLVRLDVLLNVLI